MAHSARILALIQKIDAADAAHFAELREREKGKAQADALAKAREKTLEKKRANLRVARAVNAAARKKAKNQRPAPGEAR